MVSLCLSHGDLQGGRVWARRVVAMLTGLSLSTSAVAWAESPPKSFRPDATSWIPPASETLVAPTPPFALSGQLERPEPLELLDDPRWPMPAMAWSLAGLGLLSLTSALVLDAQAEAGLESMRGCAPDCDDSQVATVDRTVRRSRAAASLGLLSLSTAAWLALAESPADAFAPKDAHAPRLRLFAGAGGVHSLLTVSFDEVRLLHGENPVALR